MNLVILGSNKLSEEFAREIRAQTEDDEVEIDCQMYTLGYRIIDGDVGLPHNSFTTSDFMPHGKYSFMKVKIMLRVKSNIYNVYFFVSQDLFVSMQMKIHLSTFDPPWKKLYCRI